MPSRRAPVDDPPCPCGRGPALARCCGRYLDGAGDAPTAEALMRSRYTAYTRGDAAYLARTWHPDFRPARIDVDPGVRWLGLEVRRTEAGLEGDETGLVEFVARHKLAGRAVRLHETSRFVRVDGRWVYRDGDVHAR